MNAAEMRNHFLLRRKAELDHIKMVVDEFRAGFMVNTYGDNSGYVAVTEEEDPETGDDRMVLLPYNYKQPRGSVIFDREQARRLAGELWRFAESEEPTKRDALVFSSWHKKRGSENFSGPLFVLTSDRTGC